MLTGVGLALLAAAVGTSPGLLAHTAASARAEQACDDPVGRPLVSFAEGLEPGPLVVQDGWLSPDGVAMTAVATYEPETMTLVELQGRRADARGLAVTATNTSS